MNTKRLASEEAEKAFLNHVFKFNSQNPKFTENHWREKLNDAIKAGYKNEICSCGNFYLAFDNYCLCKENDCPFRGKTVFEIMSEKLNEEEILCGKENQNGMEK